MNRLQFDTDTDLFSLMRADVVPLALDAITRELRLIPQPERGGPPVQPEGPCGPLLCSMRATMGLPCRHILYNHKVTLTPLQLCQFDWHWIWIRPPGNAAAAAAAVDHIMPALPPSMAPPSMPLLNPLLGKAKGRPKGSTETS